MKKLSVKLKNTPTDTQLVCSSVSPVLNREETLSEQGKVLTDNNSEVDLLQHTGGKKVSSNVYVYVLSKDGSPLMPTTPRNARILLKGGKAHVVKRSTFTIQLNYETTNHIQDVILGIDSGYNHIGFSATTEKQEVIRVFSCDANPTP
jgi:RRXRR protein